MNKFHTYYEELLKDVYPQPPSEWHLESMKEVINTWIAPLGISSVLDVGCGEGEAQEFFSGITNRYWGIAQGRDVVNAGTRNVSEGDYNFIAAGSDSYDLVFSRHSLEHSPLPIISLMEWHRVSRQWLCLVVPNPEYHTYTGRNHYSVAPANQVAWWLRRAGWKYKKIFIGQKEFWFLCTKEKRLGYEGWADAPLANPIYEFERDLVYMHGFVNADDYFEKRQYLFDKHEQEVEKLKRKGKQ